MYKYKGHLEMYFETGLEFAMIYVDHANPDPWSKTFVLEKNMQLTVKISHPKSRNIVYEGQWTYSRENTAKNKYMASPKEIDMETWKEYIFNQYLIEFETSKPIEADLCSYIPSFNIDIWEVKNKEQILIARDAKIFKIIQGSRLVVDKKSQRWASEDSIKSFQVRDDTIYIQTSTEFLIIKKADIPLM